MSGLPTQPAKLTATTGLAGSAQGAEESPRYPLGAQASIQDYWPTIYPATGHAYLVPTYTWSDDYSKVTAEMVCSKDSDHNVVETVDTTFTDDGNKRTYVDSFSGTSFENQTITVNMAEEVLMGDVNSNGTVDSIDAMLLSRYAAAWVNIVIDLKSADLNGDDTVDNADAMILARYIAGWEGYDAYIVTKTV